MYAKQTKTIWGVSSLDESPLRSPRTAGSPLYFFMEVGMENVSEGLSEIEKKHEFSAYAVIGSMILAVVVIIVSQLVR